MSKLTALKSARELRSIGYVLLPNGVLDNRDGFYDDIPDTIGTYDTRTMVCVRKDWYDFLMDGLPRLREMTKEELIEELINLHGTP